MTETPKERPILFSAETVRAILERRKTQTRRVIGLAEINKNPDWHSAAYQNGDGDWVFWYPDRPGLADFTLKAYPRGSRDGIKCPYGKPGDLLWVRETFQIWQSWGSVGDEWIGDEVLEVDGRLPHDEPQWHKDNYYHTAYKADDPDVCQWWRPSIFMPRWASRITLEVTDIGVERLQHISITDIEKEGFYKFSGNPHDEGSYIYQFVNLWDSINAKRGYPWDSNPWVWKIEFKMLENEAADEPNA